MKAKKTRRRVAAVARPAPVTDRLSAAQQQTFLSACHMLSRPRFFPWFISGMTFLVFLRVFDNGFVGSDRGPLVENLGYRGLGWAQIQWMFTGFHFGQFHPVAWLSLGLTHVLWWTDPFGYHLINLSIHIVNAVIFYHIAVALFVRSNRADAYPQRKLVWFARLGKRPLLRASPFSGLNQWHGLLRVENSSPRCFFLLSLWSYLKANASTVDGALRAYWKSASLGTFLLSLLAGPSGVFLPAVLSIMHYVDARGEARPQSDMSGRVVRSLGYHLPYIFLSGAYAVLAVIAGGYDDSSPHTAHGGNVIHWVLYQLAAPALYLWNAVLPVALTPAYELTIWSIGVFIAASIVLGALAVVLGRKWPALFPLWLCYMLLLLPVFRNGFRPNRSSPIDSLTLPRCPGRC